MGWRRPGPVPGHRSIPKADRRLCLPRAGRAAPCRRPSRLAPLRNDEPVLMRRSRPAPVGIGGRPFAFAFVPLALDSGCWFSRGAAGPATGSIPALANVAQSLDKHSYHALVEAWLFAGDRLANESYGREDSPGVTSSRAYPPSTARARSVWRAGS